MDHARVLRQDPEIPSQAGYDKAVDRTIEIGLIRRGKQKLERHAAPPLNLRAFF